jgi:DNA-binding beta-propeller fold protein YncE
VHCAPSDGLEYVCGPVASEDVVRLGDGPWLLASGLNVGVPAHLYVIDSRTREARPVWPAAQELGAGHEPTADCPGGSPDPARVSMDGLGLRLDPGGRGATLYAANHGDRHAIEVFHVDWQTGTPQVSWQDCLPLPSGTLANAVAPLPDGGIAFTSFHDPDDPQAWARMARGEPTGALWEFRSTRGFRRLDRADLSGANGLAVSADGSVLYVSSWSGGLIRVYDRRRHTQRDIGLGFLPDNIKVDADGSLWVAGQASTVAAIAACKGPACPQPWVVAQVDAASGRVALRLQRSGSAEINYACSALPVDGALFITARGDQRLAVVPLATLRPTGDRR